QVAQDFLVGSGQEYPQDVRLVVLDRVQLEGGFPLPAAHKTINYSIRVAGDVLNGSPASRLFVQPVDRHDGEQLIDGPVVRQGLENREIAEVAVDQGGLQVAHDFGIRRLVFLDHVRQGIHGAEVECFDVGPVPQ